MVHRLRTESIRQFAAIRCAFAVAVAGAKGLSFVEALRDYTDLHRRTTGAIPGESATADVAWSGLAKQLTEISDSQEALDCIVAFMSDSNLHRYDRSNSPYWPFRYDYHATDHTIRMHFGTLKFYVNTEAETPGLLSEVRLPELRAQLARMFREVSERYPLARQVRGASWLYSRRSYCRVYPAAFTASPKIAEGRFQGGARWGQFHTGQGRINSDLRDLFLNNIAHRLDPSRLEDAFPVQTWAVSAPIETFYREYGVA